MNKQQPLVFKPLAAAVFNILARNTLARVLLALSLLSACSAAKSGTNTILVGTSNDYPPLCYLDADGNLAGFEKDLLDAIDKKLPQYKFKYEVLEFKNILASLESGRLDIAAHNYGINEERQKKYLFSEEGYFSGYSYIVVTGNTEGINGFDDLRGKTISVPPASSWAYAVENYNAAHQDNPIIISYYESTPDVLIANLLTGVVDATLLSESDVKLANTFWGTDFKTVGQPIDELETARYVYRKEAVELRDAVDTVLRELKASGELERLTKKAVDDFFAAAGR
jgi:L-cystine transport system substrate-binding protein